MASGRKTAKSAAPDQADPRFEPVARAFQRTKGFSLMESKSRALRGLMMNGKSFGMSSHGRLILRLTEARTAELVADGIGKPFSPAAGRVMKSWIDVTHPTADWVALAKEALLLIATEKRPTRSKKAPKTTAKKAPKKASAKKR